MLDLSLHASTLAASPAGFSAGPAIHPVITQVAASAGAGSRGRSTWQATDVKGEGVVGGGSEVVKRAQINDGEGRAIA